MVANPSIGNNQPHNIHPFFFEITKLGTHARDIMAKLTERYGVASKSTGISVPGTPFQSTSMITTNTPINEAIVRFR